MAPEWSDTKKSEVRELVLKMAKEGVPPTRIGLALRDQHAVPNARAALGMRLTAFLRNEKALSEFPDDLMNLIRKAVRMQEHLKTKRDVHNSVKLLHVESKIGRLVKYYASKGRIPAGWKYDAEKAALLVK